MQHHAFTLHHGNPAFDPRVGTERPVAFDAGHADMFTVQAQEDWASSAALRAVYTATAATLQVDDGPGLNLPAHTLAYSEQASLQRWRLTPAPTAATGQPVAHGAWWLQFTARPS